MRKKLPTTFHRDTDVSKVDFGDVTELSVCHDFKGEIPELQLFPNLVSFHSTKKLSAEYIQRQNFSNLKKLYLTVDGNCDVFKISAPELEELTVFIDDNSNDSKYRTFGRDVVKTIDISDLTNLKRIELYTQHFKYLIKQQIERDGGHRNALSNADIEEFLKRKYPFLAETSDG